MALHCFRYYLVVVTLDSGKPGSVVVEEDEEHRRHMLTVFDVRNKFVAFAAPLARPARWLVSEWGLLFAVSDDGDCR